MKDELLDELIHLNDAQTKANDPVVIYDLKRQAWLSGIPYLWTGFIERAFVLDRPDAQHLLEAHGLTDCEIRSTMGSRH